MMRCMLGEGVDERTDKSSGTGTISDLVNVGFVLVKSKHKNEQSVGYECAINKRQIEW